MRLARTLLLTAAAAIAAMAFMASSAAAQSIEVHPEGSSTHCSDVTVDPNHDVVGGCEIHAVSTSPATLAQHTGATEAVFSICDNEFTGNINEDGTGYISGQVLSGAQCGIEPCDEAEPSHANLEWPISGLFETGGIGPAPNREAMIVTFCVEPLTTDPAQEGLNRSYCTVIVNVTQSVGHVQSFSATDAPCFENGGVVELTGSWTTEGESEIEAEHIH